MSLSSIFVITGDHPDFCIGGAEFQAYIIAKHQADYFSKSFFITTYSKSEYSRYENEKLIHLSLGCGNFLKKILLFNKNVRIFNPSVIYVRCLYSFWWVNLIAKFYSIPVVYHLSGDSQTHYEKIGFKRLKRSVLRNFYLYNLKFSDLVIAQTNGQADLFMNSFNVRPFVVYNAQYPDLEEIRKDYSKIKVLWIGKSFKNPGRFVQLADKMSCHDIFDFYMIGKFSDAQKHEYENIQYKLSNFHFIGELNRSAVFEYLRSAHVLINTSDVEGFPNTYIEAWHRGVIVISDNINPDEILTKNNIGFLCNNIDLMKSKLEELFLGDHTIAMQYAERIIAYARDKHSAERFADRIFEVIKPLIRNGKSSVS